MSSPQSHPMMTRPLLAAQPQPQLQLQMCILKYNYCECKGCDKDFAKFQKLVAEKYMIQKPSLDKEQKIITVIGTSDATGLTQLFRKAIGKKYVEVLPNPARETSQAEKGNDKSDQEKANRPEQQQQCRQRRPGATNMGEEDTGGRASRNMHNVGESTEIGCKNFSCTVM